MFASELDCAESLDSLIDNILITAYSNAFKPSEPLPHDLSRPSPP
jgi:hypothetical protein